VPGSAGYRLEGGEDPGAAAHETPYIEDMEAVYAGPVNGGGRGRTSTSIQSFSGLEEVSG
jgi:hypothetical protein